MTKTQLIIPKDVQNHVNGRIVLRVLKAAALFAAEIFVFVWYAQDFWSSIRYWTILVYAAVLVVTYFWSGLHDVIRDKTWCGVIKDVKVKTTLQTTGTRLRRYINIIYVTVETEDGETKTCVAFKGRADDARDGAALSFYLQNYRPGVSIVHIRGAKYYQIDPDNNPDTMNCIVCGYDNPEGVEICETCGHTLRLIKMDTSLWF